MPSNVFTVVTRVKQSISHREVGNEKWKTDV